MEIKGRIIAVYPIKTGVSKNGKEWQYRDFLLETHDYTPERCYFCVFGKDKLEKFDIQLNDEITASFNFFPLEVNGKYYNKLNVWSVKKEKISPPASHYEEIIEDLPF